MKKRMVSFFLLTALLTILLQSGVVGITVHAESLGLSQQSGTISTAKAIDLAQIQKVSKLAASQTSSEFAGRLNDALFKATYRPTDIGGSDWVKDNKGREGITYVFDPGLGTTISLGTPAWGCFSYAVYFSQYVRGSKGTVVGICKDSIPTVDQIKKLFADYADPGEHIRFFYKTPGGYESVHSVAFLASDSEGFYFSSENGDGLKITVHYCTYSHFLTALRVQTGEFTLKIYDTNGGKDGKNGTTITKTDTSTGNNSVSATSKPTPRYTPDTSEYKESYSRLLMWRSSSSLMVGNDIRYIQACLYYLGYNIDIDGWYGSGTAGVVRQFQTHYGLTADGDVDPSTWYVIEKAVADNPAPGVLKISTQPKDVTATVGSTVKFTVSAVGSKLSYQWYYKKSWETEWTLWGGHTTASTTAIANATWNGMQVYCKVTDGSGKSVKSNTAVISIAQELKITEQPKSRTISLGDTMTISVKAQGFGLSYQWYYKKKGQTVWSVWNTRTHASETVTPNSTWNGMQLYCKVRDSLGNYVNSTSAGITVITQPLKITSQPKSREIELGTTITLSLKAEGVGLSYQWYYKKRGTTSWVKWNTRTHASETVTPNATWDGIQLYCKVRDAAGKTLNSNVAIVTVNDNSLKILAQPKSTAITLGDAITVSVKAQGTGLSYQWYYKKRGTTSWTLWSGRTRATETVTPNATWDGIQLYCKVKDSSGKTVNSDVAIVVIN